MLKWLKNIFAASKDSKIDEYFGKIDTTMQDVIDKCTHIENQLEIEIKLLTEEVAMYKGMLHTIANTIPDMMWCKDLEGKYLYANEAIKNGLLFDRNPIGKGDIELALAAKKRFGAENHMFGEKCANSDLVVIDLTLKGQFKKEDGRFLESGKVKGKMLYLEVFKAPLFINGELIGTVGTGRDMTEYVEAFREHNCGSCYKMKDIFKKYEYGEDL
jgi:PAS domain-containing protein